MPVSAAKATSAVAVAAVAAAFAAAAVAAFAAEADAAATCESRTLACPGADCKSLKETLAAWAGERGDKYKKEMEALDEGILREAEKCVHVVACGDFNFTPQSPLYHLVIRGSMNFASLSKEKISGQQQSRPFP